MTNFLVRPYGQADRTEVFRIAAGTALFGDAVKAYLDDRRLFYDVCHAYCCDLEPEHGWVACADTQVVGLVIAAVDTTVQHRRSRLEVWPRVLRGVIRGRNRRRPAAHSSGPHRDIREAPHNGTDHAR